MSDPRGLDIARTSRPNVNGTAQCDELLGAIAVVVPEERRPDPLVTLAIYKSGKPDPHSFGPEVD